jgi:hypothetical protein
MISTAALCSDAGICRTAAPISMHNLASTDPLKIAIERADPFKDTERDLLPKIP